MNWSKLKEDYDRFMSDEDNIDHFEGSELAMKIDYLRSIKQTLGIGSEVMILDDNSHQIMLESFLNSMEGYEDL